MNRRGLVLLTLGLLAVWLPAQQEAPEYQLIPEANQRLSRVEATGTWTAKAALGWTGGWNSQGFVPSATYEDFTKGFVFEQVPDFSLGVRLLERYFLRVVYTGSVEENSFELGYDGILGEPLRWVRAGNTPFEVPSRAGTVVAPGRTGNPAFGLGWGSDSLQGEVVIRYEDNSREARDYRGFTPLAGPRIDLTDWLRGRFFQLPGAGPWNHVRVWLEDPLKSGGQIEATTREFDVDSSTGALDLARSVYRRVWASWDGQTSLTLYDPGLATGYERKDHYRLPEGVDARSRAQVTDTTTGAEVPGYQVSVKVLSGWVVVTPVAVPSSAQNARRELRFLAPSTSPGQWSLGSDVEASSLVVSRNGFETRDWDFQAATGILVPRFSVADSDEIHMVFQRRQKTGRSADALGWLGASWQVAPQQLLEANTWVRWNSVKDRYTTEEAQAPGQVAGALLWKGASGPFNWQVRTEASARLADSTEGRHLLDWSSGPDSVALTSDSLRPAAAHRSALAGLVPTQANRAVPLFRDFTVLDPLSGAWTLGAWQPGWPVEASGPDGLTGPYLVRGDELAGDRAAVLDSVLESGQWSGLQVFFDHGRVQDLSSRSHVEVSLRLPQALPLGVKVFLVVGALGENFDGSGQVKTLATGTRKTLPFVDAVRGTTLGFPLTEGTDWTNDGNGDGIATDGGLPLVIELTARIDATSSSWQILGLDLDETQRAFLGQATAWSVVVTSESSSPVTALLLVRSLRFSGSSWDLSSPHPIPPGSSATVRDIIASQGDNSSLVVWSQRPEWSLEARFSNFQPAEYRRLTWDYDLSGLSDDGPTWTLRFQAGDTLAAEYHFNPQTGVSNLQIDLTTGSMLNGTSVVEPTVWNASVATWDRVVWSSSGTPSGKLVLSPPKATDPVWNLGVTSRAEGRLFWAGQDVRINAQSHLANGEVTWSAQSSWSTQFGPLAATWNGEWSRLGLVHTGYEGTVTLALPDGSASLRLGDVLSDRLSRRVSGDLRLPLLGSISASESASWSDQRLERNVMATWNSPLLAPWGGDLRFSVEGRLADPGAIPNADWRTLWFESLGWLAPSWGVHESTWANAKARLSWDAGDASLITESEAQILQLSGIPWTLAPSGSVAVSLPWIQKGNSPWIITPRVSVQYTSSWSSESGLPLPEVLWFAAKDLYDRTGFSGDFRADLNTKLDLARLPFQLVGTASWSQGAVSGLAYTASSQSVQTQIRWDNLFGRAGLWPVFTWYRTDGVATRWEASLSQGTRTADNTLSMGSTWEPEVLLSTVERVAWPLQALLKSADSQQFDFKTGPLWSWRGPARLPWTVPEWISPPNFNRQIVLESKTELGILYTDATGWSVQKWEFAQKVSLGLSPRSDVHLTLRWGNAWQNGLTILALEAALEAVLSF